MNKIIAISGTKATGKTTTGDMLRFMLSTPKFLHHYWIYKRFSKLRLKGNWLNVSFAGSLKEMLAVLLRVPVEMFEDRDFKENVFVDFNDLTFHRRKDLKKNQILSDSKFSRKVKEMSIDVRANMLSIRQLLQYWGTEIMRRHLGDQLWSLTTLKLAEIHDLIISDMRFKVEAEMVKERRGTVIYIDRPGCEVGNHQSEKEAFELYQEGRYDYIIYNNGTLKDLFEKCKEIAQQVN